MRLRKNVVIYIMGVSGVGKSTIGNLLSEVLKIPHFDGDDYHPKKNIKKMSDGIPLNDNDRHDWLLALNELSKNQQKKKGCIISCSALKESYRKLLIEGLEGKVEWIFLNGSFDQILERMQHRKDHFMPETLLRSQFDILEEPDQAMKIDISKSPEEIITAITDEFDKSEFGLLGLGVMGKSLCRNLARNGFTISMYNRHVKNLEENVAANFKKQYNELSTARSFDELISFVNSLQKPRKIMLMVNAGKATDEVIKSLLPHLTEGDVLIDGGNSHYKDTQNRMGYLAGKNIHFIGAGISGGEKGALNGPSIMPGGSHKAYKSVQEYLEVIAAKDADDVPCCTYIGKEGSGHFVKMVHNGIEYVEMQLLAEVFGLFENMGYNPDEIAGKFESWKLRSNSYLLSITIDILRKKEGTEWLVHKILDKAGNKGTGNWATMATTQFGVPGTLIATALFARYISSYKEERVAISKEYERNKGSILNIEADDILKAYHFARIINHHQGFKLIEEVSNFNDWRLNLAEIARIWTNGCIIKSAFMEALVDILSYDKNILLNKEIARQVNELKPSLTRVVSECVINDIAVPCLGDAIQFFNGYATENSTAKLIQAQRDYFGAHAYQRIDDLTGNFHHTDWIED
jgi:6-phosphogluconate dehydrogenase